MSVVIAILFSLALAAGLALCALGAVAAFISASVNMSWNNPLPRAGCTLLLGGCGLLALGIWGLRA